MGQPDGDAPAIPPAREGGGPVDRVEDPERPRLRRRAAAFLAEDRLPGEKAFQLFAQKGLGGAIGFRQEVLRALHLGLRHAVRAHPRGECGGVPRQGGDGVEAAGEFGRCHV